MKKFFPYLAFTLVLIGLVMIEFFVSPPDVYEGDSSFYTDVSAEDKKITNSVDPPTAQILENFALEKYFADTGHPVERITPSQEVNNIFQLFGFSGTENDFRVFKTTYLQTKEKGMKEKYAITYDIFSTKPRTTLEAYADVKNSIQKDLEGNIEAKVVEHNGYGQKSFSILLEPNPKVMYLVVAYRDRLLGIEYPLGEKYSRHEVMNTVLNKLFSQ